MSRMLHTIPILASKEIRDGMRNRWARFSFDFFEFICLKFGTQLKIINDKPDIGFQQELSEDLIALITHFSAKYYGKRKYHLHKKNSIDIKQ